MTRQDFLAKSAAASESIGMWCQGQGVSVDGANEYARGWLADWVRLNAGTDVEFDTLAEHFALGYCRTVV